MIRPASNTAPAEAGCGAVPAGGAPAGGRDCALIPGFILAAVLVAALPPATARAEGEAVLPESGYDDLALHDTIPREDDTAPWRFRFVLPDLGDPGHSFDDVSATMMALCERVVVPRLGDRAGEGDRIVVTLMREPVDFGSTDPQSVQFFEAYRLEDGRCIWEFF
ncbi:DUF6497 family protein [Allosediminivita pacifica]|uniref:Acetolactate synthase n=1 Tax=Allosediminivita pacifica TaxID=1267769 RepID=A0A2T6AJA6_9RHOB|nr:DUF6497 family protein [Allosediminivita pacifica]PTX43846.1 hypothetical protein C8N44_12458 [Allosediminivita pacifica]GGB22250.1 hypothetical protein GCM10011324_35360 [Allosediminivita pacifica]